MLFRSRLDHARVAGNHPAAAAEAGQRRHRVGGHAQEGGDLSGFLAFDLGVPEHELLAFGQGCKGTCGGGVLEPFDRGVTEGDSGVERLEVIGGLHLGGRAVPVDTQTTN